MTKIKINVKLEIIGKWDLLGKSFAIYGTVDAPLFLAQEVACCIEYHPDNINKMLLGVDASEKLTRRIFRSGQTRECWFLTENGLYEVLMQSRKPIAKKFKEKVKEILHTIRKTGSYALPKQQSLEPLYTPAVRTYQGQRVVTIKDISLATKQPEGSIAYWINTKCRKATDFVLLRGAALQTFKSENGLQGYLASRLYVVFESGFRKLCKMLGILPEKTGCFPAPVLDKQLQNFKWKRELRTDVPDNKEIQMILRAIRKRIAAFDIMLEEFDRYNVNTYQEKVKTVLQRIATRICTDTFELTDKHYELVEKAI